MIAVITTIVLLAALIFVLRGPSTRNNKTIIKAQRPKSFSKYLVNKDGWLEVADEDRAK
ncbi:hypothetical protein [Mucilaginibacter ginsenosidivorax]|uniref:hypothetical protein n=1 Tax=Mucilaginibacter ginsenosidivorax TaxID=862126 RepID=UPI001315AA1E|nr:hypothetical protein [Mucilaginibacter ginsenosidivorax]